MTRLITPDEVIAVASCGEWLGPDGDGQPIRDRMGGGMTVRQIANAEDVDPDDRHWLLLRLVPNARTQRLYACHVAERAWREHGNGDPRPSRAIEAARGYAEGEATADELAAAEAAARASARASARAADAAAWAAADAAADAAAAARGAADATFRAAARDAEAKRQIAELPDWVEGDSR